MVDGETVYSNTFTMQRTGGITASSAGTKRVGEATNTWGTVTGAPTGTSVWTEVNLNGRWSRSQTRTTAAKSATTAGGSFVIPLTYGINSAGTTTWRVGAQIGSTTIYSNSFTLTRTGSQPSQPTSPYQSANCTAIKGNISSTGEKIYHVPGGRHYNQTQIDYLKGERCFRTAAEARAAGWRASQV